MLLLFFRFAPSMLAGFVLFETSFSAVFSSAWCSSIEQSISGKAYLQRWSFKYYSLSASTSGCFLYCLRLTKGKGHLWRTSFGTSLRFLLMYTKMFLLHIILLAVNLFHVSRPFYMNRVAQTWYFFKALYFLLSAYQIRAGYPKRVRGNFLTKSYGTVNLFLFKG